MKTTIEIPDGLYKRAKFRAVEQGQTLRQVVLRALERELAEPNSVKEPAKNYWADRKYRPGYRKAFEAGAFSGGTDSTEIISEDRSSRDDALL